ncbi:hypothetical protein R3P38DRAFT_3237413 [Favolaschia claudopus]|uniref:CxC2-like cysteine cluster KDZ transposase-associated domain-containing protein n=1 Tax=Favolaschia claudopus TaxID=2862362 RepID=A0AAV9ZBK6_9AGAR
MTLMMKRAGRGHSLSGIPGTAQGELALPCRACPQDGTGRMESDKLGNYAGRSPTRDPVIDDGLGYFGNRELYKTYLRDHVDEEEISTCSGFQAMFLAGAKRGKGLRTTGVGGVTCARHNMWRPNGIGDLQRGERYCNMDFILFSLILNAVVLYLILSYDIACQYSKKFWERMKGLPEAMQINPETTSVWFKVPSFHILGHKWPCHSPHSFHWMWGAGMTDGEDVEQNWEFTNGAAGSTKMMGPGGRHAFLEGLFAFHNWMRTVSYRKVLSQRLVRDLKEGRKHKEAFEAFTQVIEAEKPELVVRWKAWVKDWESSQHTEGHASPFEVSKPVKSLKEICLQLGKDELTRTGQGIEIERQHTSSTFIALGLNIEDSQRVLAVDIKATTDRSPSQELDLVQRKASLLRRVNRFRNMQRVFMPELARFLPAAQHDILDDRTRAVETVKLFMPSELGNDIREKGEMREAELADTLEDLRHQLRLRSGTNRFCHRNICGQKGLTRGQGVLRQTEIRIHKAKLRYRYARNALLRIRGHGTWEKMYRSLADEDVRGINERAWSEEEEAERERLRALGEIVEGGVEAAGIVAAGEGSHTMSWIWYKTNLGDDDAEIIDALRVEWCKAYARTRRWHEDIILIEEEMRRTIEYGVWMGREWERCAAARSVASPALAEGLNAYAKEHVRREEVTCQRLRNQWAGLRLKAARYLERVEDFGPGIVVNVDGEDRDEEDEEGDVAGDEVFDDGDPEDSLEAEDL